MRIAQSDEIIQKYVAQYEMQRFLNRDLLRSLQLFQFPPMANVYYEQDEQHYLHFLVEGAVQCGHYQLNGRVAVFALSTPFTALGDLEILSDEPVWSSVIAIEPSTMLGIDRSIVERYGADDPKFLRFLIDQLRDKLYKTNGLQANQIMPVIHRLAMYMLAQQKQGDDVLLPGKEQLASLLGTTTRHLNRVLKQLVESGAISDTYPRVRLLDRPLLLNLPV
ncbi:MAG TPA: Crp/Fnr family transcriptional regulator [Aggregatilineales bacterium]|jgi:CRP-like cAMP-binding protein|nr:Crp/Fnr family transcriptional regulator [Aggregatilineales bacterium]